METIFNIDQSLKLARSIAKREGLEIITKAYEGMPRVKGKKIYIGEPSMYTHEVFMEELHKCIGAACEDTDFFNEVQREGREDTLKEILRGHVTDRYLNGEYQGRDRQLASAYKRNFKDLQENLEAIHEADPTAATLLALGNKLRNQWQGFNRLEVSEELAKRMEKFRRIEDQWLSLETAEDLEKILQDIKEIENEEEGNEGNNGEPDSGDSSDGDGKQGSESAEGPPEDQESDEDSSRSDSQDPEAGRGEEGASEGEPEDDEGDSGEQGTEEPAGPDGGEPSDSDGTGSDADGGDPDADGGESGESECDTDSGGDSGGDSDGSEEDGGPDGRDEGRDGDDSSGGQPGDSGSDVGESGSGGEQQADSGYSEGLQDGSRDSGESDGETPEGGEGSEGGEHTLDDSGKELAASSYADTGDSLRNLGILPEEYNYDPDEYYQPISRVIYQDNRDKGPLDEELLKEIQEELKDFRLTQQVKRYLMAIAQDRWRVGQKRGKMNPSKMHRIYTHKGDGQPRIYKRKEATKVSTDIALTLLVDASGSMNWTNYGRTKNKYVVASAAAIGMSEVLQSLKISHEILMFTTDSHDALVYTVVRDFRESYVSRDKLMVRFSRENLRFSENADGEAIMWAAQRLVTRKESEKLLVVLSDGQPSAWGPSRNNNEGVYNYTRDVVALLEETKGLDILGLGIMDNTVAEFYTRHKVMKDLSELETVFMDLLKSKLIQ